MTSTAVDGKSGVEPVNEEGCTLHPLFTFAPGVELGFIDPPHMLTEVDKDHGNLVRGYIKCDVDSFGLDVPGESGELCWPVYFGESQAYFKPDEVGEYVDRCGKEPRQT